MVPCLRGNWLLSESRIITDYTDFADFKRFFIIETKVWTVLVLWTLRFKGMSIFPRVSHRQGNRRKYSTP